MVYKLLPGTEVEKYKLDQEIIRDTAKQVIKDFNHFGISVAFPPDINYVYNDLYVQLKSVITGLIQKEPEKLAALLYRIDLDEQKLNSHPDGLHDPELISGMILEREFHKVLTRYYFRNR